MINEDITVLLLKIRVEEREGLQEREAKYMYDILSEKVIKALEVAAKAHQNQHRKGSELPYIVHPVEVAMTLLSCGEREELVIAGLLHDILEDTEATEAFIKNQFGEEILDLVLGASEKLENRDNTPWLERKEHTIEYLKNAGRDIQIIACSDKLSNIKSMIRDYEMLGDQLWQRFSTKSMEDQRWYYTKIVESLQNISEHPIYKEFKKKVEILFMSGGIM